MNTKRHSRIEQPFDTKAIDRPCCYCGKPRPAGRRRWCSDECVTDFRVRRGDASLIASLLRRRDQEACQQCGTDLKQVLRVLELAIRAIEDDDRYLPRWRAKAQVFGLFGVPQWRERLWDADHILPVAEGGGGCGLDNYRTLCIWCHKDETAKLAKRRAIARQDHKRPLLTT